MAKRVALVTGGMGGLGEAICIKLAEQGFAVVATYSSGNTRTEKWLGEMEARGFAIRAVQVDVGDYDSCQAMARKVTLEIGAIDVLVNNAGITRDMTFK